MVIDQHAIFWLDIVHLHEVVHEVLLSALSCSNILSQINDQINSNGERAGPIPGSERASRKREAAVSKGKNTAQKAIAFFNSQDAEMNDE